MDDREAPDPLKELGERIDKARGRSPGPVARRPSGDTTTGLAMGLRIGLELVVAVLVGVGVGWLLDRWLGTRPWGVVACFFLGIAAGMVNVYRAVTGAGMAVGYRRDVPRPNDESDED